MATATVDSSISDHHLNHLHSESIPLIDLHLLSQSELFSLSLCSSSSSLHHHQNDPDVSTLKIDRSVFNESAGSRKQTFSRLRLAPRNTSQFSAAASSSSVDASVPHQTAADLTSDVDSSQIVALLKSLFGGKPDEVGKIGDNLVSVPVQYNACIDWKDAVQNVGDGEMKSVSVEDSSTKKRKRGRPRRDGSTSISNDNLNQVIERTDSDEIVEVDKKEELVRTNTSKFAMTEKLEEFGNMEDPYVKELTRRTIDMQTQEQLLEFLQGLDGEWLSNRKKRKLVGASALGDFLPKGWKLMLCMKKRAEYYWIVCRRFISPNGQQFMSCKEASSYINSPLGLQDASQINFSPVDGNIQMVERKSSGNASDVTFIADKNEGDLVCCPEMSLGKSVEHEKELEVGIPAQGETVREYKCHKCTMVFHEPDDLLQHLLSYHQRAPKRLRQETSTNEEVIINNGKYECQFCHKSYDERHRYNGHLGNHIKDFKRIQASGGSLVIKRGSVPPIVAVHPSAVKLQESTEMDTSSVAINSNTQSNDDISYAVPDCKVKEHDTTESYCGKQGLVCSKIDDKSGGSNDIAAVETNRIQEGSPKCSSAVGRRQMCAPYNNENQLDIDSIEGHAQEMGSDNNLVAVSSVKDSENIKDRLLSSAISSVENHDSSLVAEDKARTVLGHNCASQEDVAANGQEQKNLKGRVLIPSSSDQRYASVNDAHMLSASTAVDMTYERGSQVGLSSPFDEKTDLSNDKVNQVSTTTLKEPRYDDMGDSSKNVLTVDLGSNNVTVEDFVTATELDSSSRSHVAIPTWIDQTSYSENEMNRTHRCTIKKQGEERRSEGEQLNLFGCEQYLGSENTTAKVSNDTRKVPNHDEVEVLHFQNRIQKKEVNQIAAHVTAAELESSSGNSLLVPSGNELTFSVKENEVVNDRPKDLVQDIDFGSSSNKPDQILNYENDMVSLITVDQPKHKEVKSFSKGDMLLTFDYNHMEWDADVKSTIQESYSSDCSLVTSGNQWSAAEANLTSLYCSPLDEQKRASDKGLLHLSNNVEEWSAGHNSDRVLTGGDRKKLAVVKPRKKEAGTGLGSTIQTNENVLSELIWKHDEENDLLGSFADTSGRLSHSSGCFTAYDLMSNKGGNELFGEKFSGISCFEGLRSGNMENMEYNFMSNHSEETKVFSGDTEITQGLCSSAWLEKEALPLLPKTASRQRIPALCAWCKNEVYFEDFESETQIGSLSFTCAACKAKFSGSFNFL